MLGTSNDKLEKSFGFRKLKQLEQQIERQTALQPEDFQNSIQQKIDGLIHRLTVPLSEPSWGPRITQASLNALPVQGSGMSAQTVETVHINLEKSHRFARYSGLYLMAALLGVCVTLGALYVDYEIMNEFWTRILADEFLDVPPNLANSVISKSAQVIFATAAFHFFLSRLNSFGRTIYIWVFFLLTFAMISGFGLMNANISMPANPEDLAPTSDTGPVSIQDALDNLGLKTAPDAQAPARPDAGGLGDWEAWLRDARPVLWLIVPGFVFVVVTGIGALSLQLAETNLQNFVKSRDYRSRVKLVAELEEQQLYKALVDRLVGRTA